MKNDYKIIAMITTLVIVSFINGFYVIRIFFNNSSQSPLSIKKQTETKDDLKLINTAIKSLEKRKPFFQDVKNVAKDTAKEASESSMATAQPTKKLILKILNGTEIAGIANSLKDTLSKTGLFSEIILGNTESTTASTLKTKNNIPSDEKAGITNLIKKDFPNTKEEDLAQEDESDMTFIIGSNR